MTELLRILMHISNSFQTLEIMEKTLSDKNEPYLVQTLQNIIVVYSYLGWVPPPLLHIQYHLVTELVVRIRCGYPPYYAPSTTLQLSS